MAKPNEKAGVSRTLFTIKVSDEQARAGLKSARRELNKDTREVMLEVATRRVVPRARRLAPSIVADSIIARATSRTVYISTKARGMKRRIAGYMEFGGSVKGPILYGPDHEAIHFTAGGTEVFVRYVKTPRKYAGMGYMRKAVERERRGFLRELDRKLPGLIQRHVDGGIAARTLN